MRLARIPSAWFRARAALAIFALLIQAMVPNIVAAEIALAGERADGIFANCLFGHVEEDADHDEDSADGSHRHHHDHGDCGLCPICLALLASPAFASTAAPVAPVPTRRFAYQLHLPEPIAPTIAGAVSYRSRAPPAI